MRYADGPATEVSTLIAADIGTVWNLVTDISLPARFSSEFRGGHWLDRAGAAARVPAELGLRTNLIGTDAMVKARLRLYRDAGISTLRVSFAPSAAGLDRLLGLVAEVNAERPEGPG